MAGEAANKALGLGLGEAGQSLLGSGLVGGVTGAVTGKGVLQGALQGVAGQYVGNQTAGSSPWMADAGKTFGNFMTAGYDPKTAAIAGGLSGLATGIMRQSVAKPSDAVVAQYKGSDPDLGSGLTGLKDPVPGTELVTQGGMNPYPEVGQGAPLGMPTSAKVDMSPTSSPWTLKNAMLGMTALGMLQDAPEPVKTAVNALSPEQKKYFNLPNVTWDWTRMQQDAEKSGMSLGQFMSQNWPQITGYSQGSQNGNPSAMSGAYNQPTVARKLARGGPLSQIAYMAQGSGTGRDDTIDAKLSDGEYVMDAETVALLGDGSNKAGAERLDAMREAIRAHKGKTLARGAISPDAKSPLAYLKGAR